MEIIILAAMISVLGICVYFARFSGIVRSMTSGERRSGRDRRKSFKASKNKMRRSADSIPIKGQERN